MFSGRAKSVFPMGKEGLDVMIEKVQGKGQKVAWQQPWQGMDYQENISTIFMLSLINEMKLAVPSWGEQFGVFQHPEYEYISFKVNISI